MIGVLVGVYFAFVGKALPDTYVGSLNVSGMTETEAKKAIEAAVDVPLSIDVEGKTTEVELAQAGITVDIDAAVADAFSPNQTFIGTMGGIFNGLTVKPDITVDEDALHEFANSLPIPEDKKAVDANIAFSDGAFHVTPSVDGLRIDEERLVSSIKKDVQDLSFDPIKAKTIQDSPVLTTKAAEAAAEKASKMLKTQITIDDGDGITVNADAAQIGSWITFEGEGGERTPKPDKEKVAKWLEEVAGEMGTPPRPGIENVDGAGKVVATVHGPASGWIASNLKPVTDSVVSGVAAGTPVKATLTFVEKEGEWEKREADPATEGLLYRAAPGEKWIDINLAEATVTAYEGAKVVGGPYLMVPGAPETPTIEGEFNVYLKYETQTMKGENADGSEYETPDVPWVTYFEGGYALHGAYWRDSFGWNGPGGSHGCVNMPVDDAYFIYSWSDMGTKVLSHY
jgi:Uncharacterized protein conserved in bacteria